MNERTPALKSPLLLPWASNLEQPTHTNTSLTDLVALLRSWNLVFAILFCFLFLLSNEAEACSVSIDNLSSLSRPSLSLRLSFARLHPLFPHAASRRQLFVWPAKSLPATFWSWIPSSQSVASLQLTSIPASPLFAATTHTLSTPTYPEKGSPAPLFSPLCCISTPRTISLTPPGRRRAFRPPTQPSITIRQWIPCNSTSSSSINI